jgi:hypothetical protein
MGSITVLWVFGQAAFWARSFFAPFGNFRNALQLASIGAVSSLALRSSKDLGLAPSAFRALFIIGNAGVLLAGIASGMKGDIMLALLPTMWFLLRNRTSRLITPRLILSIAAAAALYFAVVYPVIQGFRLVARGEYQGTAIPVRDIYNAWSSGSAQAALGESLSEEIQGTLDRLCEFIPAAFIVSQVRAQGLQLGATMGYAWYAFIPRIIWPNKPQVNRGAWFSVYVGFARSEDRGFSLAMTAVGELYWNFGLLGVFPGMFLIGSLAGLVWRTAGLDPRRKPLHMTFYILISCSMREMAEAVNTIAGFFAYLIIFKVALALVHQWSMREARLSGWSAPTHQSFKFKSYTRPFV